jgi:beta-lactamase regulating signal transducer with metallopeptidase domain
MSMARRWSEKVTNTDTLLMFRAAKRELGIRQGVNLMTCACIKTPMMIGFVRPTVLLPRFEIPSDELRSILKHELIHFKRRDLWCKALMLVTLSLHWFNPIVHIMLKRTMELCEISCDERVLKGASEKSRALYGEAIIGVIRNGGMSTSLSTNFFTSIEGVKSRVYAIMDTKDKRFSPVLMMAVVGLSLLCMTAFAIAPQAAALQPDSSSDSINAASITDNSTSNQQRRELIANDGTVIEVTSKNDGVTEDPFDYYQLVFGDDGIPPEDVDKTNASQISGDSSNEQPQLIVSD